MSMVNFLLEATKNRNLKMVKTLLEGGANIKPENNDYQTALMIASEKGHAEIVKLLEKAGAR